jgi:hypothetical protein
MAYGRPDETTVNPENGFYHTGNVRVTVNPNKSDGYRIDLRGQAAADAEACMVRARAIPDRGSLRKLTAQLTSARKAKYIPIAKAHVAVEAASLMRFKAVSLFDAGLPCEAEANMTKPFFTQNRNAEVECRSS